MLLTGGSLTAAGLVEAATAATTITLDPTGLAAMAASRRLIDDAITQGKPVYGVTRGLGSKAVETLTAEDLAGFSLKTVQGRSHAVGDPFPPEVVRASMIVRANTLLSGHTGARPAVAEHIVACLNAQVTPVVGSIGSIGVADLLPNAGIGLALVGQGLMVDRLGEIGPSGEVMARHGIAPLRVEARDGLALVSHNSTVVAHAAFALNEAEHGLHTAQTAVATSIEAFRANLSALDDRVLGLKPLPGQMAAAHDLRKRLKGSALFDTDNARRLQDPLSIRNIAQIHGTVMSALGFAKGTVYIELNGPSDNPIVLVDDEEILSCGLYFTSELCNGIDTVSRSFVHLAAAQLARTARHLDPNASGLPALLTRGGSSSAGLAPVLKVQEALFSELAQAAQPGPIWPSASSSASGVEDCVAGSPTAVKGLQRVAELSMRMSAVELIVACQAFELRAPTVEVAPFVADVVAEIQRLSPRHRQDQPLSLPIERVYDQIRNRTLVLG